jgi:predicted nuclease of predicted toxin-antitoxin system
MKKIKFCIDESVDFPVVTFLRKKGFDVKSISEFSRSLEDNKILNLAYKENRIIITNDKDFGNLIFKQKLRSSGVILIRLHDQYSKAKIKALEDLIDKHLSRLLGNFVVISISGVRIRKIH